MPINIVAYALALFREKLYRNSCILFCVRFAATVDLRACSRALEENNFLQWAPALCNLVPRAFSLAWGRTPPPSQAKGPGNEIELFAKIKK